MTDTLILTAEQLATKLPLHAETIRRWARQDRIPHYHLGSRVVFIFDEVFDWLRSSDRVVLSVVPPQPEREAA